MSCSALDLANCPAAAWAGIVGLLPWWAPWVLWGAVALIALWALSKVKDVAGNGGVAAVLGIAAYLFGYWRGHKGENIVPIELAHDNPHDVVPAPKVTPKPVARPKQKTIFDIFNPKDTP